MNTRVGQLLVVDDNLLSRQKLSILLQQQGHTVVQADNGLAGIEHLKSSPVDVVLLDLLMPEMDGFTFLEIVKADPSLRDVPVIVISALDEVEGVVRCIEMGAEDYLPKQFDPVILRARIQSSLQRKQVRDLEKMLLQQELALRQTEKLATLGRLSAGLAHELNNPAAAVKRGASIIDQTIPLFSQSQRKLETFDFGDDQKTLLANLENRVDELARHQYQLDALARSDREIAVEEYLHNAGVGDPWESARPLVELGLNDDDLVAFVSSIGVAAVPAVSKWLSQLITLRTLAAELMEGASRVSEIIKALKAYSYMDQAPVQDVDLHEGLDNTLLILRSKLKNGIDVERDYDPDLPVVEAFGSELNQVWTNLIDNAIDAMAGKGKLAIRTRQLADGVQVEIEDNGPGIPDEIVGRVFDPFFTTKEPGKGTGLGLSISHNIVTNRHKGNFSISTGHGGTTFSVWLPRRITDA